MMVPAPAIMSANRRAVSGPISRISSSAAIASTAFTRASASAANDLATTTSVSTGISALSLRFAASSRATSSMFASYSDLPTSWPAAAMNVLAMPPPTIRQSTTSVSASSTVNFVDTLEPPMIATNGRAGLSSAVARASSSATNSGPAQATGAYSATPYVLACVRCAVPKASITKTSHKDAIFFASASSQAFSPSRKRTFSSSTTAPTATSTPLIQSLTSGTSRSSNLARWSATGCRENWLSATPSVGRPRCDINMTAAPASSAASIVGMAARIRESEVTSPPATGTFRSSRIKTRLPCRSTSVISMTDM